MNLDNIKLKDEKFWAKIKVVNDCWEWQGCINRDGYGDLKRRKLCNTANIGVHRYAFYLMHNKFPDNFACHICNNRICCNPNHLYDGTHADNMNDMIKSGNAKGNRRDNSGENNPRAKLTKSDAEAIKLLLPELNNKQIAKIYNVHHGTISLIRVGKSWAN